jgi:sugar phosphate isomerase/epimerase
MTFSLPQANWAEVLDAATRFGYDGVEPRPDAGHGHGVEPSLDEAGRQAVRQRAADAGVAIACIASGGRFADPATAAENIEQARACIDLAGDLGAPVVRVFGGALGEGVDRPDAVKLVAESLGKLADFAAERDVVVAMETHDDWCDPDDVAAVMRAVDHPAVGVNWDLMHPVRKAGRTIAEAFETLRPWIRHVHVHDAGANPDALDFRPIGTGDVDHAEAFALLRSMDYGGWLSGEWIKWEPGEVHLPRELEAMKRIEASLST